MFARELVVAVGLTAALLAGCDKKETAPAAPAGQPAVVTEAPAASSVAVEVFSTSKPKPIAGKKFPTGGKANVEALNKKKIDKFAEVKTEEGFELVGWAIDDAAKSVPETVVIELAPTAGNGAKYYAMASRNTRNRDDVANFFKEPAYKKAGFILKADIAPVPAGEYEVIVVQVINGKPSRAYPACKINKVN